MAFDDTTGAKPASQSRPVALRIKLRYDDVDAMVQRFACNVGRSGLFLPTRSLHPVGTEVKFELRIANDAAVLVGLGKVKAAKAPDPENPKAAFGLAIELMRVTRDGREIIIRMLERRRELALPEVAIPMPEDVEAARRVDVETQSAVPTPAPGSESAPITAITHDTETREPEAISARATPLPEALLTSPRPVSGPLGVARGRSDRTPAPVLAPEPARAKRPQLADLVARAAELSGPVVSLGPLASDEPDVDVGKAIARARMLAGDEIDVELEALREASAAPIAIDVEAASAELARQLGGAPISRKDRSARWARPPAVAPIAEPADAPTLESVVFANAMPSAPSESESESGSDADPVRRLAASGDVDQLAPEAALAIARPDAGTAAPSGGADGRIPVPAVDASPVPFLEVPSAPVRGADDAPVPFAVVLPEPIATLDQPVVDGTRPPSAGADGRAQIPAVEDDPELLSFERALDAARVHTGTSAPAPGADDDISELDSDDLEDESEHTEIGEFGQGLDELPVPVAYQAFAHEHPSDAGDFAEEEISELDVIAEADAGDDDLLSANGERDSSTFSVVSQEDDPNDVELTPPPPEVYEPITVRPGRPREELVELTPPPPDAFEQSTVRPGLPRSELFELTPAPPPNPDVPRDEFADELFTPRPVESSLPPLARDDFAARLALDEDDEPPLYPDDPDDNDQDSEPISYTEPEAREFRGRELELDGPPDFARHDFDLAADEHDPVEQLDNALSTLDVDLDKLEVPQAERRRPAPRARPLPGMPPARASRVSDAPVSRPRSSSRTHRAETDDGVLIDFEDDDDV